MTSTPPSWDTVWLHFQHHPLMWGLMLALLTSPLLFHELGHWMVMRRLGIPVEEFGFGFGPRLFRIKRFCWRLLPLGAYVSPQPTAYRDAGSENRLWMALAGPVANFGYAALLMLVVLQLAPATPGRLGLLGLSALSVAIGVINLIPLPPLDGWIVFQSLAEMLGAPAQAASWENSVRRVQGALIYGLGALFVLWLLDPSRLLDGLF